MLVPRKVKHRKQHHPRQRGIASGGTEVNFGDYGIQALEHAYVTNRQIEAARIAINRHIKRGGKMWINVFPDRPLTKKPAETRMGSGKGSPEWWIANVKPGRGMFELSFPNEKVAREAAPNTAPIATSANAPAARFADGNTRFTNIANTPPSAALDMNMGASNPPDVPDPSEITSASALKIAIRISSFKARLLFRMSEIVS